MPALGSSANAVLDKTIRDLDTGVFWYYSKSMRDEAFRKIEGLTKDKMYPLTVERATIVINTIKQHELSSTFLAAGNKVLFIFMTMDKKAKGGDHGVIIRAEEGSDTVDVALDTDPSSVFSAPRVLLFQI